MSDLYAICASGNISIWDLGYMFDGLGMPSDVDLPALSSDYAHRGCAAA